MRNKNIVKKNKAFWLYLNPFINVSIKKNHALLYNTLNFQIIEYRNNSEILNIIRRLNSCNNLYVIKIQKNEINENVSEFINQLKDTFSGGIVDISLSDGKPVQLRPKLSLQKGVDLYLTFSKKNKIRLLQYDNLKNYLLTLSLIINEECTINCEICKEAYLQSLFCRRGNKNRELRCEDIAKILMEVEGSDLQKLNILGGDIFQHSEYFKLVDLLKRNSRIVKELYTHYSNIQKNIEYISILNFENLVLVILIDIPFKEESLREVISLIKKLGIKFICKFEIREENDLSIVEHVINENGISDYRIFPFFDGTNIQFFKANVFISKNDIVNSAPTQNDIFMRSVLNTFYFGNLTIDLNKDVYSNQNNSKIGSLDEADLISLITKELHHGRSWAKLRKHVQPCKQCVYNVLCPSITNYEYSLGYYNLCNIWKN